MFLFPPLEWVPHHQLLQFKLQSVFTWLQLCIFEACLCCSFLKQQSELVVCSLADGGLVHQVSSSSDGGPCLWDLCRWAAVYTTGWLHLNMSLCWKTRTSPNVGKHTLALTDGYEVQGFTITAGAHDATAQHEIQMWIYPGLWQLKTFVTSQQSANHQITLTARLLH